MSVRMLIPLVTLIAVARCSGRVGGNPATPCPVGTWSEPRAMLVDRGVAHVESPQIVSTPAGLAFLGDNAVVFAVSDSDFSPILGAPPRRPGALAGFLRRAGGRFDPIPQPPGQYAFIGVRAVGDRHGNAHVFWGTSADTGIDQANHVQGVRYAQFDGTHWTTPQSVLLDSTITWNVVMTSIARVHDDVHLVIPTRARALHLRRRGDGTWFIRRLPSVMHYTALTSRNGVLYLAYTHAGGPGHRTAISVIRSSDGGERWSTPVVVERSGRSGQFAIRLVSVPTGVYAVWESAPAVAPPGPNQIIIGPDRPDTIKAAVSRDAGMTWQLLGALPVPQGIGGLVAARGPDDAVHVAFQVRPRTDTIMSLATAVLAGDRWSGPQVLGTGPGWPMLMPPTVDALVFAWVDWRFVQSYRLFFTRWSVLGCRGQVQVP